MPAAPDSLGNAPGTQVARTMDKPLVRATNRSAPGSIRILRNLMKNEHKEAMNLRLPCELL